MFTIEAKDVSLSYGDKIIFQDLNLSIPRGKISVLIGANGCGKSTILRSLSRVMQPQKGEVILDGADIAKMSTKDVAKKMAILPQTPVAPEGLTVLGLVRQGRYPYQNWFKQWSQEDEEKVRFALQASGLEDLQNRTVDSLSGGQRQRAWIALTLAQDTDILLLDEPTTYLDLTHQIEVLDLLYDLNEREGRTIVMVLHDINLACRYAHHILAIKEGKLWAEGPPEDIVDEKLLCEVFGLQCQVGRDPIFGTPVCIPGGRGRFVGPNCEGCVRDNHDGCQ
ncbi:ABC transporter ATP-binding protein [Paenibacillus sp. N1-5-1-14]|uniref:ABC transporter ATP-binding protein n=1 Tax=Paenibacillus radicibacter TaxID=2972488 RepID=UPI0021592B52|nr:ABC transporter ATP-binding protein [Paenibacillus radicibacter]MCR8644933.1 ABC transporter ATP-binding protein [Paenibacillus radicibacter]